MKNHHMAVPGKLAVKLDHVGARFYRFLESHTSIFGITTRRASVCYPLKTGHLFGWKFLASVNDYSRWF
jgi:hypothetical protein